MRKRFKKIYAILSLAFVMLAMLFVWHRQIEQIKLVKMLKKNFGIKDGIEPAKIQTAQSQNCLEQKQDEDKSALFIGCNGFY